MSGNREVPIGLYTSVYSGRNQSGKVNTIEGITPNVWFGPLQPLPNFAPDDVAGRQWDFPVGYNIQMTPRPLAKYSFSKLREVMNNCDIMQVIINNRKDQIEARQWTVKPKEGVKVDEKDTRIKEMLDFWAMPDRINTFDQWIRPWLDDMLVIDAPALYVRRERSGGVYGIEVMDGATIKLLVDKWGRRPPPPSPAFQQILKGVPAIAYTNDELIYSPRNLRSYDPYGKSPVEMTVVTINAAINRAQFNMAYYTEGNIPDALGGLPENFTPQQAAQFTEWWDSMYSGNLAQRRKVKFVPGLSNFTQLKEPELKNVYDDYIARILCFAIGISPQPFVSAMNRATAETAKESSQQEGRAPIENAIKNVINRIIQGPQYFGYTDLEFGWIENEDPDLKEQADILKIYVDAGIISRDAAREKLGEEPEGGIAAELCITTAAGIMTLEDADEKNKLSMQQTQESHDQLMAGGAEGLDQGGDSKGQSVGRAPSHPKPKANKAAGSKKKPRKIRIASLRRRKVVAAKKQVAKSAKKILDRAKYNVVRDLHLHLVRVAKSDSDDSDMVSLKLDLSALAELSTEIGPVLQDIAANAGELALGSFATNDEGIVNQVYQRAVDFASDRAAELVTQLEDGTRERLRKIIADGLADNIGRQGIVDDIIADESGLFSEDRAQLIADYEVGNANGEGSLMGLQAAEKAGVVLKKEWYPDAEACPICTANAEQGPIPVDEEFESGDMAPLAHPNCECSLLGVVE